MDQAIERIEVPRWAWLLVVLAALGVYLVTQENGTLLRGAAHVAHEFFHDGRHFLGLPCH